MEDSGWAEEDRKGESIVDGGGRGKFDILELVYGVLFDPAATMKRIARQPPVGLAVLTVTILNLLVTFMGMFTFSRVAGGEFPIAGIGRLMPAIQAMFPLIVLFSLFFGYLKWFVYSSVLHLAADFLGGNGRARGVFTMAGLAGLPSIFMVPFQFLALLLGSRSVIVTVLMGLAGFAILVWSAVLLVIGIAQVHQLSAGRAALVVFIPALSILALLVAIVAAIIFMGFSMSGYMGSPAYY